MDEARVETEPSKSRAAARFGAFELRLDTGELRKHGVRVRLQGKPFQLLRALMEQAGHVVTREELKDRLWSSDTFVDFESGLNTAVNRLRVALGDSAESPIYVETLSRIGYRFVAPVSFSNPETPVNQDIEADVLENPRVLRTSGAAALDRARIINPKLSWTIAGVAAVTALCLMAALVESINHARPAPSFRQITFREGSISNARFAPGSHNVVFSAAWNGQPSQLFLTTAKSDVRALGFSGARLLSLSRAGELLILPSGKGSEMIQPQSVSLTGGTPHPIPERARSADWGPDGKLCLVREDGSVFSIEYPPGRKIYTADNGWISDVRVSSRGEIAFAEHPMPEDDAGRVMILDSSGGAHVLSSGWASLDGLAWYPSKHEVWFTGARSGVDRALMAVDLSGRVRQIAQTPGGMQVRDIAPSGQVLFARTSQRMTMFSRDLNRESTRDISWLDWSRAAGITSDAKSILFDETGSGGGKGYSVYLYARDTNAARRLGDGRALDISDDGRWALAQDAADSTKLSLISIADRKSTPISGGALAYRWAKFINGPSAPEILFSANYPGRKPQIFRQSLPVGVPRAVSANFLLTYSPPILDPSGRWAAGVTGGREITLLDLANGTARSIKTKSYQIPIAFLNDRQVIAAATANGSILLESLNLQDGKSNLYRRVALQGLSGTEETWPIYLSRDLRTLVYSQLQSLSDLFIASGWQ